MVKQHKRDKEQQEIKILCRGSEQHQQRLLQCAADEQADRVAPS